MGVLLFLIEDLLAADGMKNWAEVERYLNWNYDIQGNPLHSLPYVTHHLNAQRAQAACQASLKNGVKPGSGVGSSSSTNITPGTSTTCSSAANSKTRPGQVGTGGVTNSAPLTGGAGVKTGLPTTMHVTTSLQLGGGLLGRGPGQPVIRTGSVGDALNGLGTGTLQTGGVSVYDVWKTSGVGT